MKTRRLAFAAVMVIGGALLFRSVHHSTPRAALDDGAAVSVAPAGEVSSELTTEPSVWKPALAGYEFSFPRDHAAHEDYRIEWWYYTGNVETDKGRRFGYELTFFRTGIDHDPENPSRWSVRDLYITHFAISDVADQAFHQFERVNRRGIGWAGAETDRFHAWNDDWEVQLEGDNHRLVARDGNFRIDLTLRPLKPLVVHGSQGVSRKGPAAGNASHYYSFTRLETTGTLSVDGVDLSVKGLSWMDHEFSTSFLEPGQAGWDWFAVQLDDGRELMIYQMRRDDGSMDPHSSGTLIDSDGVVAHIRADEFTLERDTPWKSPATEATYPTRWTIRLPGRGLRLDVRAVFPNQEMDASDGAGVIYWEGCVDVVGSDQGRPVSGRGYLEMTGYAGQSLGTMLR